MIPRRVSLLILLLLLSCSLPVLAQQPTEENFTNGFSISGEIYTFYHSVDDPDRVFGRPITILFNDLNRPGIQVQYFERVRMDYDPSKPEGQRVSLGHLGEYAYNEGKPGIPAPSSTGGFCRSFPKNITVCYAFLQFYEKYADLFGPPITNAQFAEDGRLVQYFQNVRLEWKSEMPTGQHVVVSLLGRSHFDRNVGNPLYITPPAQNDPNRVIKIEPKLYAFIARPLVVSGSNQTVYVLVYDQFAKPLKDINVALTISYPGSPPDTQEIALQPTNALGYSQADFKVKNIAPNQVVYITADIKAGFSDAPAAYTAFRVWW